MFWAWNNAGWVLGELGDYDEAMRRLDRAIELDPTEVTPWRNKTMLYLQHDQPDAAERCLEEMVGTVSDLAAALNVKAAVLTDWLGRDEEALEVSEQAARLRPGDESITANIAETLLKLGRWGKARKTAQQVLARTASVNTRSVMLFLIWASHVLDDGGSGARARTFGDFMDYYREHFVDGPGRPMEWTYRGLKRAIPDRAPSAEAAFLVTLVIDLQEARLPVGELTFFGAQDQLVAAR
jgi:tetratricopeptide (TPR) repeat protein